MATNWNEIAGKWEQLSGELKKQWGKLTDGELTEIDGNHEKLSEKIQEKYGIEKQYADSQIDKWVEKMKK